MKSHALIGLLLYTSVALADPTRQHIKNLHDNLDQLTRQYDAPDQATVVPGIRGDTRARKCRSARCGSSASGTCPTWPSRQPRCQISAMVSMSAGVAGRSAGSGTG